MPSRRELIQMTEPEIAAFLTEKKTLIIVSNGRDGYPHPMPMWFATDSAGALYCTTFSKAQKVLNFERDPKATLLVEAGEEYAELKSVLIYADTTIVRDADAVAEVLVNISTKGTTIDEEQRGKVREQVRATAAKRVALKFTPSKIISWDHAKLGGKY
ncbi:MAG: pyridoxamine 5'-phosphate oxidase family protein [Proteobacteria bacterium]|nr:pyridoxamine 5'-phosphate oxidase family protein [Pseudomonadota bacterium]